MTYTKEIKQDYVFQDLLEDTLISTDNTNKYLIPDIGLGFDDLLGDDDLVSFYAPRWDYSLPNSSDAEPYYFEDHNIDGNTGDKVLDPDIACILPIYGYVHSGVSISTSSYSCQWDSGQIGYAYITKQAQQKHGLKDKYLDNSIRLQVNLIDKIYQGDIYTIVKEDLDSDGNVIDYECIGGYIGYESAIEALKTDI